MKRKKQKPKKKNTAQAKLIKKMRAAGKKVAVNPKGTVRMSDVIENFAEPLLTDCRSDDDIKKVIQFAVVVWNLTMFPEDEQDKRIQEFAETLCPPGNTDQINETKIFINSLIKRKKELFPHIQRIVVDYQLSGSGSNFRLGIVSKDR
ncbi:MAG: hypothetical protein D3908_14025 [Candidatus Electrothrix sp. AUS4]|nr:hypothetical protein [Candidatus Electrothrix sp. AUS4]